MKSFLRYVTPELRECLELVDEFVNDLPQPLVGQLQVDRRVSRQDVVEQLTVVVVGLEPLLNSGSTLHSSVNVPEVKLPVQVQEDRVISYIRSNVFSLRPRGSFEELFSQFWETVLVEVVNLVHIAFLDHVLEVLQELLDLVWHGVLHPVHGWVTGVPVT